MPRSVLDAIREGDWTYEPSTEATADLKATTALPGTPEKLAVLAERLRLGLPLWHPADRRSYNDQDDD